MVSQQGFLKKVARPLYLIFLLVLGLVGLAGGIAEGIHLVRHFYLWPLVRLTGYGSLLVYALLMLWRARYNTRP